MLKLMIFAYKTKVCHMRPLFCSEISEQEEFEDR